MFPARSLMCQHSQDQHELHKTWMLCVLMSCPWRMAAESGHANMLVWQVYFAPWSYTTVWCWVVSEKKKVTNNRIALLMHMHQ